MCFHIYIESNYSACIYEHFCHIYDMVLSQSSNRLCNQEQATVFNKRALINPLHTHQPQTADRQS